MTGEVTNKFLGHEGRYGSEVLISSLSFSMDSQFIVAGLNNGGILILKTNSTEALKLIQGHSNTINSLSYLSNNQVIVSSSKDGTVRFWDAKIYNSLDVLSGHKDRVSTVAYSNNEKKLASGSHNGIIKLWSLQSLQETLSITTGLDIIRAMAFSPDDQTIATGSNGGLISLWDAKSGLNIRAFEKHGDFVNTIAYSPNGKLIASGANDNKVRLWEVKTGNLIKTLTGHRDSIHILKFSINGEKIISGSSDSTIRIWDTSTGKHLNTLHHDKPISSLETSSDGRVVASGSRDNSIKTWNINNGKMIREFKGHEKYIETIGFRNNDKELISIDDNDIVRIWDNKTGVTLKKIKWIHRPPSLYNTDIVFSSASKNSRIILSSSYENQVLLWKLDTHGEYPTKKLLYDYEPKIVADALSFLWGLRLEGFIFTETDYPSMNYFQQGLNKANVPEIYKKYALLFEEPFSGKNKIDQLVEWLENKKAYRRTPAGVPQ